MSVRFVRLLSFCPFCPFVRFAEPRKDNGQTDNRTVHLPARESCPFRRLAVRQRR